MQQSHWGITRRDWHMYYTVGCVWLSDFKMLDYIISSTNTINFFQSAQFKRLKSQRCWDYKRIHQAEATNIILCLPNKSIFGVLRQKKPSNH